MKHFLLLLFVTLSVVLSGCKKDNTSQSNTSTTKLSLDKSSLTLFLGYTDTLHAAGQQSSFINWASSNDSIATVTDGQISAVGKGTATITAKITGKNESASCEIIVNDMSDVVSFGNEYILLNDSTEQVNASIGNSSPYNVMITRVALYSTKNVLILDNTLSKESIITIPAETTVITRTYFIGNGNLYIFEPGDTKGVVFWTSVFYFDYNNKHYKVTDINNHDVFTVQ